MNKSKIASKTLNIQHLSNSRYAPKEVPLGCELSYLGLISGNNSIHKKRYTHH